MEVIIIIAILIIIGSLIYQSQPSVKLKKAEEIFKSGHYIEALKILEPLFDSHPDAPAKIAEIKILQGQNAKDPEEAINYYKETLAIKSLLSSGANVSIYKKFESKASLAICETEFKALQKSASAGQKEAALLKTLSFLITAERSGLEKEFRQLEIKIYKKLALYRYEMGKSEEKSKLYTTAIQSYTKTITYAAKAGDSKVKTYCLGRVLLCRIKSGENVDIKEITVIDNLSKEIYNDIMYRYIVDLVNKEKINEADDCIKAYMDPADKSVLEVVSLIEMYKKREVISYLERLNREIDLLYDKSYPHEDVKRIYQEIQTKAPAVKKFIPALYEKLNGLRPSLFNRQLSYFIEKKHYGNAFNLINEYPEFWKSPELLKDLALCCYGYINEGKLNQKDHQIIISSLLTSVYSDRVLLNSLNDTTWDDDYTFTLIDAIGSAYELHENLPENVNYDEISETNISIGTTQKELLNRFELLIHQKIEDPAFYQAILDFYQREKEAIEKVISVTAKEKFIPAPYFGKRFGLNEEVVDDLGVAYDQEMDYTFLEAGLTYIKSNRFTHVHKYKKGSDLVADIVQSAQKMDTESIKIKANNQERAFIFEYPNLQVQLEQKLYSAIDTKLKENGLVGEFIPILETATSLLPKSDKLKHQYADFINKYCVLEVNEKRMNHVRALQLTTNVYLLDPKSVTTVKNLITLIGFNVTDIFSGASNTDGILAELDRICKKKSKTFEDHSYELLEKREEILQHMKSAGIDTSMFENSISPFKLGMSLNDAGQRMKKTLDLLKKLGTKKGGDDQNDLLKILLNKI